MTSRLVNNECAVTHADCSICGGLCRQFDILFPKNVLSNEFLLVFCYSRPHIQYTTVQRFIVTLPSCTLKPDDHSICISAMFAHKQIHLTRRVKGLYVAAISSVNQSMKSSNRQYLMKSNSKLSLRTRIFVSKSSILRPVATIFPQYATCRFPHGIT